MNGKHNQHNLCKEGEVGQKVYYIQIFGSLRYWMSNTSQCKVRTRIKKNKRPNKRPRLLMAMMTTFSPFSILCLRKKNWGWKIFFPSFLKNLFDMWDGENCDGEMWDGDKFDGEMWASVNNVHCTIVHSQELQVWNCSYLYDTNITRLLLRIPV